MNGKLRKELAALRADVASIAGKLEGHATADAVNDVHEAVKAIRADLAGQAKATQSSLKGVTSAVSDVMAKAAELVGTTPAPPPEPASPAPAPAAKTNGGARTTPTRAATAASKEQNS